MRLTAVRIRNIRKFGQEGIAIQNIPEGLSVLAAPNEFGKTTLFDALRTVLFEKHSTKAKTVRELANVDGVSPLIEVDFVYQDTQYRLRKQFLKQSSAQLTNLDTDILIKANDDAHDWIIDMIGAKTANDGPTGLLWIEQGESMQAPVAGDVGKNLLATMMEHEIGNITGGDRARILLRHIENELGTLITKNGAPKAGPYKSVITECDVTRTTLTEIRQKISDSESLVAELQHIEKSLHTLEDSAELQRIENQRVKATKTLQEAKEANKLLDLKRAILKDKQEATQRKKIDFESFLNNRDQVISLDTDIGSVRHKLSELESKQLVLDKTLEEIQNKEIKADQERQKAEKIFQHCMRLEKQTHAREKCSVLDVSIQKAERASDQINSLTGRLQANLVTQSVMQKIQAAYNLLEKQRARLDASRPVISPNLTAKGRELVTLDGKALTGQMSLSGRQTLGLGEFGDIQLDTNDPNEVREAVDKAELELTKLLSDVGLDSVSAAQKACDDRLELEQQLKNAQYDFNQQAPDGLTVLKQDFEAQSAILSSDHPDDVEGVDVPDMHTANQHLQKARHHYDDMREARSTRQNERYELKTSISDLTASLKGFADQRSRLVEKMGKCEQWDEIVADLSEAVEISQTEEKALQDEIATKEKAFPPLEILQDDVKRFDEVALNRSQLIHAKRERRAEIKATLVALSAEGLGEECTRLEEKEAGLEHQKTAYDNKIAALHLLQKELSEAQQKLQDTFLRPVSNELRPLLDLVLPEAEIGLDENFNAGEIRRAGRAEPFDILSGGTKEQIAVLTRLAFAQLMARRGRYMPVVLDDALVWCDDERLENIFRALRFASKDIQCIVLTCHERAFSTLGAPILAVESWPI